MQTATNLTGTLPIKKSPYSQQTDAPATQAKAFNRTIGLANDNTNPEAETQVHHFFNNQLPTIEVPPGQAKALRDYIVMQLNNYLATILQQPDLAIIDHTDSAPDACDRDSSSTFSAETGNNSGSPQSVVSAIEEDGPQGLCRQLLSLKATVTDRNLGLDNAKIKKHLKQQLPKKTFKNFENILKEQPRTERAGSANVDTTNRMINTILIMGQEAYQPFFNALTNCSYHGLFQPEMCPRQPPKDPGQFLNRTKSLPGRSRRHRSQEISRLSSSMLLSSYPGYQQNAQQPGTQTVIEGPMFLRLPDNEPQSIPIRVGSKNLDREEQTPVLKSFMPTPPTRDVTDTEQLAAKAQLWGFSLPKTTDLGGAEHLPPPPECAFAIQEEPKKP